MYLSFLLMKRAKMGILYLGFFLMKRAKIDT